jgi:hypothetical protein
MFGITKSDLAGGARWIRDHFSSWFANSFVMVGVFAIIICAIIIGMYFDGAYARRWAPEASAEGVFRNYGWLISLAMVFFTAAGLKAFQEGARFAGGTMFVAGLFFTVLSATQSIGVVTLKAQQMMASADAFAKIETTDTTRLDFLKAERQEIIETRNSEIARIEKSIDAIRFDDIPGIPKADQDSIDAYNARIDVLRNEASEKVAAIGDEIKAEMETPEAPTEVQVAPARFDPGIEFWAYVLKGPNATNEYKEGLTYWYMLFWSIGCPIMGQMLAVYLVITRRTSTNATDRDSDKPNDPNFVTLPQIEGEGYWETRIAKALKTRIKKPTAQGIKDTYFDGVATIHELRSQLQLRVKRGLLSQRDFDFIMREGQWAPKTEQELNGTKPNGADDADGQDPVNNLPA